MANRSGTLQLTFIPGFVPDVGATRAQIEAVRVRGRSTWRWAGRDVDPVGRRYGRGDRGCVMVQLTSGLVAPGRATASTRALGFEASHVGMKLPLI